MVNCLSRFLEIVTATMTTEQTSAYEKDFYPFN